MTLLPDSGYSLIRIDYGTREYQAEIGDGLAHHQTMSCAILSIGTVLFTGGSHERVAAD